MNSIEELYSLKDKVALITGGSRGLGREMALAFAKAGADIIIVSRKLESCEEVAKEVEELGGKAYPYACHVGRWDEINKLVDDVYLKFDKVDILVNNAGMSPLYESLTDVNERMWDSVLSLNLKGPFRLSALVGERMSEGDGGSIINVSSIAAVRPTPIEVPYSAAKAGLNILTVGLAAAYGPKVRVNCIMPGPFLTDISKAWDDNVMNKFKKDAFLERAGEPHEIIGAALYLASDASSYTTGSVMSVDGGYLL
ncbi:glucose 1-dehydrogenase [Oceanobacillus piezotolerans]|uniref:Glucose 1-dehydrogenase n=1 Tax=Oceanobacillus piezotolerans TaxID=2448030 RepID=A0A498DDX1_9BACI|nr:glucose 1-dehydrogenase [Oceanobacillus piezotolerans]RLL46860.1 glucose 1-dehydrogenase [Oceanobacillus piezotolerans]